jgi:hypothetical protein
MNLSLRLLASKPVIVVDHVKRTMFVDLSFEPDRHQWQFLPYLHLRSINMGNRNIDMRLHVGKRRLTTRSSRRNEPLILDGSKLYMDAVASRPRFRVRD